MGSSSRGFEAVSWSSESNHELNDEDWSRPPAISLGAFTRFKPVSRNKGAKSWRHLDFSGTPSSDQIKSHSDSAQKLENGSPDPEDAFEAKRTVERVRGRPTTASPHPLRKEVSPGPFSPQQSAQPTTIEDQFGIEEWDPDLAPGPEDPTILESMPLTPKKLTRSNLRLTTKHVAQKIESKSPLSTTERSDLSSTSLAEQKINSRESTQEAVLAKLGVQPRLPEDPFVGNSSSTLSLPYSFDAQQRNGSIDFKFRFPRQLPHQNPHAPGSFIPTSAPASSRAEEVSSQDLFETNILEHDDMDLIYYQTNRKKLLESLHGIVDSSSARSNAARTVLHDPESVGTNQPSQGGSSQTRSLVQDQDAATGDPASHHSHQQTGYFPNFGYNSASADQETIASGQELHPLRGASEPLPWTDRPVSIHTEITPALSDAELEVVSNARISQTVASKQAMEEAAGNVLVSSAAIREAERWWNCDNRGQDGLREYLHGQADRELHDARYRYLSSCTAAEPETDQAVEQAKAQALQSDTATRLLIPIIATLHEYVAKSPQYQRDNFGSFASVPEWCVDTSQNGLSSFFGEDWGAPPARLGRDPRYRPYTHDPGFTSYGGVGDKWHTGGGGFGQGW
ncbi:MAG: hypothetical protein M1837_001072 [Sclerophora amabilis]|nr:MAG: hypothetical protein M1837_001072 [Sclerophora amabilis]